MAPSVSLVKCSSYDEGAVDASVSRALDLAGGIGKYVKKGDKALLKINLLSASAPEDAITTHPSVVKAVVKQVQSVGGIPVIGDSPGGPFNRKTLEHAYEKSGMTAVAEETGAVLNYDTASKTVSNPEGRLVKKLDIISLLDDVDVVITMPKLKTHLFTRFTGSTKILFGVIPGLTKPAYHLKFPDVGLFSDMLLDILVYVKPSLSIMDGVIGLEGDGPGAQGDAKKAGIILASQDSVALDAVATTLIGMDPLSVPILKRAADRIMWTGNVKDITVLGERIDDMKVSFRQPSGNHGMMNTVMSSSILRRIFLKAAVPYPVADKKCVRCGICKQNCPAGAITITDKARMDYSKCIRCYCCHELCPHKAIRLKRLL
jgi:uncharacterized protein (DUF362 family)/Pyruvate/2-oxoacid:ferredoxin oxidoreductase delta subunit